MIKRNNNNKEKKHTIKDNQYEDMDDAGGKKK